MELRLSCQLKKKTQPSRMDKDLYVRAQRAVAELKGVIYELLAQNQDGLTNAEIGRKLGIYQGHIGHEGHISRTLLAMLEQEEVATQNKETKVWVLTNKTN